MNKEQRKFKKVMKARKTRKRFVRRTKNKYGEKLPIALWPEHKSKKFNKNEPAPDTTS